MIRLKKPATETGWKQLATSVIRANLKLARWDYGDLSRELAAIGVEAAPKLISAKLVRGTFSAAFFLQALHVMGVENLELPRRDDGSDDASQNQRAS